MKDTKTIILAIVLISFVVMMILPVPSWVLDLGIATSFAISILVFTVVLFINRPLEFSVFPTVLLASLVLRLSLNLSSTKLIIGQGHTGTSAAGHVIEGFAMFIMGGSVVIGLVIFSVLLIVNFVVITKGATRMAEVGARFALDAMPGKQLAIDSDLSAGAITHEEAKARRKTEQEETAFFGSLDGASKFVKGDAIAGLLITLLNLVVGLVVGSLVHDMSFGEAFETYTILTVGDGLVNQVPAVILAIASAMLLARGGAEGSADKMFFVQLGRYPNALYAVAALMAVFAFVPGLPFVPFFIGGCILATLGYFYSQKVEEDQNLEAKEDPELESSVKPSIGDILDLDEIHLRFAPDLISMALDPSTGLEARVENMRSHVAENYGMILPEIRLTDDAALPLSHYTISIQGVEAARALLRPDKVLAILAEGAGEELIGEQVLEPVYGAPARWISAEDEEDAALKGCTVVSPTEVLATDLLEKVKDNFGQLINSRSLKKITDVYKDLKDQRRSEEYRAFFDEMIPEKVPKELLISVLRLLLAERVSIRNLVTIVESISEARGAHATPESICEHVRQRLGPQIIAPMKRSDGSVPLVQMAPAWEEKFSKYQVDGDRGQKDIALPPEEFSSLVARLSDCIARAGEQGNYAAVITSMRRRKFLQTILSANGVSNPVISFEEFGTFARPSIVGVVEA